MAIEPQPDNPELTALMDRVQRCYKRSRRAEKRLSAAEIEVADATAAGRAACAAVKAWQLANPDAQGTLL